MRYRRSQVRGPKKFYYTYEDISSVTGLSVKTLIQYVWRKSFDPYDLDSLMKFIMKHKS
jgi:hypothetical protein